MACKSLRMCSARAQLSPNRLSTRGVFSLGTWMDVKTNGRRDAVHQGGRSFHLLHRADISYQADRCIVLCHHHNNAIICKMAKRLASSCLSWSPSSSLGCPRHRCCCFACQPVNSTDVFCWLDCSGLLALMSQPRAPWHLLTSSSLEHQCTPWMSHVL